jgi:2-octaprenyl-6-methoxyphenol hydroxylase
MSGIAMKSTQSNRIDVVVAGGGMVGLTLGLALARAGLETVVVDGLDPALVLEAKFDGRVSSFATASRRMLLALGLWPHLQDVAQPILDIVVGDGSVKDGASAALLHFDHREMGDQPLAHMIENRHFRMALQREIANAPSLTLIAPQRVTGATLGRASIEVILGDGRRLEAALCIAADGRTRRCARRWASRRSAGLTRRPASSLRLRTSGRTTASRTSCSWPRGRSPFCR